MKTLTLYFFLVAMTSSVLSNDSVVSKYFMIGVNAERMKMLGVEEMICMPNGKGSAYLNKGDSKESIFLIPIVPNTELEYVFDGCRNDSVVEKISFLVDEGKISKIDKYVSLVIGGARKQNQAGIEWLNRDIRIHALRYRGDTFVISIENNIRETAISE